MKSELEVARTLSLDFFYLPRDQCATIPHLKASHSVHMFSGKREFEWERSFWKVEWFSPGTCNLYVCVCVCFFFWGGGATGEISECRTAVSGTIYSHVSSFSPQLHYCWYATACKGDIQSLLSCGESVLWTRVLYVSSRLKMNRLAARDGCHIHWCLGGLSVSGSSTVVPSTPYEMFGQYACPSLAPDSISASDILQHCIQ